MKSITLSKGTEFTYGQNAQENSELTRKADKNHIWMHVSNTASAHGILHTDNLYNSDINEAADIIKRHSKAKDWRCTTVIVCVKVRYVKVKNDNGSAEIIFSPRSNADGSKNGQRARTVLIK
jgi:predicted ribosome quality control (RQC) complex YloA/Tae2 family protein